MEHAISTEERTAAREVMRAMDDYASQLGILVVDPLGYAALCKHATGVATKQSPTFFAAVGSSSYGPTIWGLGATKADARADAEGNPNWTIAVDLVVEISADRWVRAMDGDVDARDVCPSHEPR